MKKILYAILFLCTAICAQAQVEGTANEFKITFNNPDYTNYCAAQIDVTVGNGLTLDVKSVHYDLPDHDVKISKIEGGYRFLVYSFASVSLPAQTVIRPVMSVSGASVTEDININVTERYTLLNGTENKKTYQLQVKGTPEIKEKTGDLNGDGVVDTRDIVCAVDVMMHPESHTQEQLNEADMNNDAKIDAQDIVCIMNKILGK